MSTRIRFIQRLFELSRDLSLGDTYKRYREMGRQCKLADYLNGHATNYAHEGDSKPTLPDNGFVALNVEASSIDFSKTPIIPFFSIAVDGKKDTDKLRGDILGIAENAGSSSFLTCPQFMNEFGLEKVLFRVSVTVKNNAAFGSLTPRITLLSAFNEDKTGTLKRETDRILELIEKNGIENTFLYSWCLPFLHKEQELYCNVRAVDRDENCIAHSVLVTIFNTEQEIKDWVSAYGEDVMNIITIVKSIFISDIHKKQLSEALKSAVSAIMSRNMSHNLGSHYLYYTKSYLEDLATTSGDKGPDIRGAAKVLGYMQARMDYLATIISNDRYPNGAVNFKSQIYDELTVDDFSKRHFAKYNDRGKRTTNFLLSNLVMSENFTRPSILVKDSALNKDKVGEHFKLIRLQVRLWNGSEFQLFTGAADNGSLEHEKDIKNELSKLNIALPGGTMSCHAFFNVLENFIRNSAKYLQADFKEEGLVFTIDIKRNEKEANKFNFVIFDNKKNAKKVFPVVMKQLENLRILDESGGIEKSSKGLKEMLFSSVWMRTYKYPFLTFADIISIIQNAPNGPEKLKLIEEYGFRFVSVGDSGRFLDPQSASGNLGLLITLPEFNISTEFVLDELDTEKDIIAKSLEVSSDIVCFGKDIEQLTAKNGQLLSYFTRPYFESEFNENDFLDFCAKSKVITQDDQTARKVYRFKRILDKRFSLETDGDIDHMCLILGDRQDMKRVPKNHGRIIYFERHLNTKKGLDAFGDYAYADSISGGNFTITLNSLIDAGITPATCRYKTWHDKLLGLKIKESALTRITLIDERLFNSMKDDGPKKELEYSLKNVRVLNVNIEKKSAKKDALIDLFEGNSYQDGTNQTHFLSIHLGLIEKIVKSEWGKKYGKDADIEERVTAFMQELMMIFGDSNGEVFISVHSGRGNFSKELEGPLATYPFISLAAIENAFTNSKFLLSQLFYNTIYIGKGIINR